jgi:hypothetical protein
MRRVGALTGMMAGATFGPVAAGVGFVAGGAAGGLVSQWSGNGDYKVTKNTLLSPRNQVADFNKSAQSIVVRHREFIGTIVGSSGFTVQYELPINPGLPTTFPWLSGIASKYQQYEVKGMIYQYLPTSGTFNGNDAALGTIMMQTTYRATDSAPLSKVEMLNEYWSNEIVASQTMLHAIECDPKENPFAVHYVRNTPITTGEPLMYDVGKTFIATQGMGGASPTSAIGDLWVTYEIMLKKPIVSSDVVEMDDSYLAIFLTPTVGNYFSLTPFYVNGVTRCTFLNAMRGTGARANEPSRLG